MQVESQPEVGEDGYDAGAAILTRFFHEQIKAFLAYHDLDPLGRQIIEACLDGATADDYTALLE